MSHIVFVQQPLVSAPLPGSSRGQQGPYSTCRQSRYTQARDGGGKYTSHKTAKKKIRVILVQFSFRLFSWVRYQNRDQRKKISFPYLHRCTEIWRCQAGGQRRCWRALGLGRAFRAAQTSPGRTNLFLVIISTWTYLDVVVCPADARGEPLSQTLHLATGAGLLEI